MPDTSFIAALPKVDLHLHLVGSASPDTVLELARRHPDSPVPLDLDELQRFYRFRDFAHFIEVYYAVDQLVRTPDDLVVLIVGAARDAALSGVRYAEVTVTVNTHLRAGMQPDEIRQALETGRDRARTEHGVELGWIVDIPGEFGLPAAEATVDFLDNHAPAGTVAIGLAGVELGVPRAQFAPHVARARSLGFRSVIHAGESTGPEPIWSALRDLRADRIGHGIRAVDDALLVEHLASARTPLEVCITSNVCTAVVPDLVSHPLAQLHRAGVVVTLATDDPGMFSTSLNAEYAHAAELIGADHADLVDIAEAGVRASFAEEPIRRALLDEIAEIRIRSR